jgi:hypothetical protein
MVAAMAMAVVGGGKEGGATSELGFRRSSMAMAVLATAGRWQRWGRGCRSRGRSAAICFFATKNCYVRRCARGNSKSYTCTL